jgi:hypothetical protein
MTTDIQRRNAKLAAAFVEMKERQTNSPKGSRTDYLADCDVILHHTLNQRLTICRYVCEFKISEAMPSIRTELSLQHKESRSRINASSGRSGSTNEPLRTSTNQAKTDSLLASSPMARKGFQKLKSGHPKHRSSKVSHLSKRPIISAQTVHQRSQGKAPLTVCAVNVSVPEFFTIRIVWQCLLGSPKSTMTEYGQ